MSTVIRDLWPDDIKSDDVVSPEEILNHQAERLEVRTNGLLIGHIAKFSGEDRIVLGFEVEAPRAESRVRLFEVQHRLKYEYPAAIIQPDEELPDYLKPGTSYPGLPRVGDVTRALMGEFNKNEWIVSSPAEFSQKIEKVLAQPSVKAIVLSLLSRVNRDAPHNGDSADESSTGSSS